MDYFNFERTGWARPYSYQEDLAESAARQLKPLHPFKKRIKAFAIKFSRILPKVQRQVDIDFGDDYNPFGG